MLIDDNSFTTSPKDDQVVVSVTYFLEILETKNSAEACIPSVLLCSSARSSTNVESSHCQLCTRLTDTLSSNYPDGFTHVDQMTMGQVTSITKLTSTVIGNTG
jgi:hypothetical protein